MNLKQTIKFSFKRQKIFFLLMLIYMLVIYIASMPIAYSVDNFDTTFSLHIFAAAPIFFYIIISAKDLIFSAIANGVSRKTAIIANICVWAIFAVVLSCVCTFSETALSTCFKKYTNSSPMYNGIYVNDFENDIKYYAVSYGDNKQKEKTEISEREYNLYRYNPEIHKAVNERCGKAVDFEKYVPVVPPTFRTVLLNILYSSFDFILVIAFAWFAGVLEIIISYSGYSAAPAIILIGGFIIYMFSIVFARGYIYAKLFSGNAFVTFVAAVIKIVYDLRSFVYGNPAFAFVWQIGLSALWTALALYIRKFIRVAQTKRSG